MTSRRFFKQCAYGLDHDSLRLIRSYLSSQHQRIKLDSLFSSWIQTIIGVPQGCILRPLFFNIFLNDLLVINLRPNVSNFADDNTLRHCRETTKNIIKGLQSDLKIVLKWFRNNQMKANPRKFQYMLLGNHKPLKIEIEGFPLEPARSVSNQLGQLTIDHNLTFDTHMSNICKTASAKVKSLSRIRNVLVNKRAKLLYRFFILSQFNYCSIIWMFYSKTSLIKIEQIQKRGLRIVYKEPHMSLEFVTKVLVSINTLRKQINTLLTDALLLIT